MRVKSKQTIARAEHNHTAHMIYLASYANYANEPFACPVHKMAQAILSAAGLISVADESPSMAVEPVADLFGDRS